MAIEIKQNYTGSGPVITSRNPANGQVLGEINGFTTEEAAEAVERARKAQKIWAKTSLDSRIEIIKRFQYVLTERADEVCRLISQENGKPLQEAMTTEVLPIIDLASYFAGRAKEILADQKIPLHMMKYRRSYIQYRPHGIMLIISPWNFPFTIPAGTVIMGLLAGNAIVHKPASLTPLIALKTRELFNEAGLDPDLYQVMPGPGRLGSEIIDMGVNYVCFTGSTEVGVKVAQACAKKLIHFSMELGGKDPAIVCEDANVEMAARAITWGAFANAGQICASVERVYAHQAVYDRLVSLIVEHTKALRIGDPSQEEVDVGPLIDEGQVNTAQRHVEEAVSRGAKVLTGGKRIGNSLFFEPTVLVDTTDDMEAVRDETFGPLLPIMKVSSDEEAIERSNNSIYGLSAYIFTENPERGRRIASELEAGTIMINDVLISHGCPETPWQGCKMSGVGRVHSDQGLRDLCYGYHIQENALGQPSKSPFWYSYSNKRYQQLIGMAKTVFSRSLAGRIEGIKNLFNPPVEK